MQIEYVQPYREIWEAKIEDTVICTIIGTEPSFFGFHVYDKTNPSELSIPGSPFESLNKAKAVIEYHYRHLL